MSPPAAAPPRRRWLSFTLRGLLIVFTALALTLGWYANRALRQRAAVAVILQKGGRISYSHNDFKAVPSPELATPPPLAGLLGIDFVDTVTVAEFLGPQFNDDDLQLLDSLPRIHWLRIYETKVTGSGFDHVARCRRVTWLLVNHSPLTDEALPAIGRMRQLTTLHLVDTRLTDAQLHSLAPLTALQSLSLSQCSISDAGLEQLPLPATLTDLSLENTRIGDRGIELLQRQNLPLLTRLCLYGSQATDASIPTLTKMPQVTSIILGSTQVTPDGLRQLQAARSSGMYISPDPDGRP